MTVSGSPAATGVHKQLITVDGPTVHAGLEGAPKTIPPVGGVIWIVTAVIPDGSGSGAVRPRLSTAALGATGSPTPGRA